MVAPMSSNPIAHIRESELAEHANEIRRLGKRAIEDIVKIGEHLIAAKALVGHGGWLAWLRRELGWASESSALRFMHVAEFAKSVSVTDLNIDLTALYHLAAPSTPPEVVEHVVALGRRITDEDVATRWITYGVVEEDAPQARRITYPDDAEHARRTRYGVVEETPAREVRVEVAYTRETVVVPYYVQADDDQPAAETPRITDIEESRIRSTANELLRGLGAIVAALAGGWDIGEIVAALTDAERDQFRKVIEVVDKLKAALNEDEMNVEAPDKLN
jgi:hypothetical protein